MKFLFRLFCLFTLFTNAAFALEPEIVVTVKKGGEGFIVDAAVDVPVPLRTAWDVLTDFDHMTAILSNLKSSRIVRRDGQTLIVRQEGAARFGLFSFSFESEREIRLEPMTRIRAKQLAGTAKRVETESRFMPTERGTHLDYRAEIVPDSVLARLFGASFIKHEVAEQFRAMAAEMARRNQGAVAELPARSESPAN